MIPKKGLLRDVFEIVVTTSDKTTGNGKDVIGNVFQFFPEFEKVIKNSMKGGSIDREVLEENLSALYYKKFSQENFDYFFTLKNTLLTEEGERFLKRILS